MMSNPRIKKTLMAVFFGRGLMAFRQILLVPLMLSHWGASYFGAWLIVSSIPSFLAMSNPGLGTSAAGRIANRSGDGNLVGNRITLVTASVMIAAVFGLVTAGLGVWCLIRGTETSVMEHEGLVVFMLMATLFVRMLAQPFHGCWVSIGRASTSLQLSNVYFVVDLVVCALVPMLGGRAELMTAVGLGWSALWLVSYLILTMRVQPGLLKPTAPTLEEARFLLGRGIGHQMGPLWQAMLFQGSILIAAHLFGSVGSALWGALRVVNRAGNQALELVSQSVGPEFQINRAKDDLASNRKLHAKAVLVSVLISTSMATGLMVAGSYLFTRWTHGTFEVPPIVWYVMPAGLVPFSLWWVSGEYQRSMNQPWALNAVGTLAAAVSLITTWAVSGTGIASLAWGSLVFELIMACFVLRRTLRLLGQTLSEFSSDLGDAFRQIIALISGMRFAQRRH